MQNGSTVGRRIDGNKIKGGGGHRHQQGPRRDDAPVFGNRAQDLPRVRAMLALQKGFGFLQRTPQHKNQRNNHTANKEGNTPAPFGNLIVAERFIQRIANQRRDDDSHLLAGGLPAGIEPFFPRRGDFRQIDRHAAELDARRESLQQATH